MKAFWFWDSIKALALAGAISTTGCKTSVLFWHPEFIPEVTQSCDLEYREWDLNVDGTIKIQQVVERFQKSCDIIVLEYTELWECTSDDFTRDENDDFFLPECSHIDLVGWKYSNWYFTQSSNIQTFFLSYHSLIPELKNQISKTKWFEILWMVQAEQPEIKEQWKALISQMNMYQYRQIFEHIASLSEEQQKVLLSDKNWKKFLFRFDEKMSKYDVWTTPMDRVQYFLSWVEHKWVNMLLTWDNHLVDENPYGSEKAEVRDFTTFLFSHYPLESKFKVYLASEQ